MSKNNKPKILLIDIETAPIIAYVWGLWENNVALNQIKNDWFVLSWSAKWLHDPPNKIMYADQRKEKNIENDKPILQKMWQLLNEADIVIGQNSKEFDIKKLNARFIIHGLKPPSSYRQIDTMKLAKKYFGFTSNKLEYMADKLNTKYKKQTNRKFNGFEMWRECLARNLQAWKAMEQYNKYDVLALEELYLKLAPWGTGIDLNIFNPTNSSECSSCGGTDWIKFGYRYTNTGKYQRFICKHCGFEMKSKVNNISKEDKKGMKSL